MVILHSVLSILQTVYLIQNWIELKSLTAVSDTLNFQRFYSIFLTKRVWYNKYLQPKILHTFYRI